MRIRPDLSWCKSRETGFVWLGQAGFWIETGQHRILIDPYLSDSLARKYAGKKHPHKRMMQAPCSPHDLPRPDIVLITHAHTDHMDPDTLGPLFERFPDLPFVVPSSRLAEARARIGEQANLIGVDADEELEPIPEMSLKVFPAAHEELATDSDGRHLFLGYGMKSGGLRFYHSGDTIPFDGLLERVDAFRADLVMLPVNGRDETRLKDGVPGNMTFAEALYLARGSAVFVPHHWGMFSFNTESSEKLIEASKTYDEPSIIVPQCGVKLAIHN